MPTGNSRAGSRASSPRPKPARTQQAAALPSAALSRERLIEVGTRHPLQPLVDFATTALDRAAAPGFAEYGFDGAWVAGMREAMTTAENAGEQVTAGRRDALPSGERLEQLVGEAKDWRRIALTAVALLPSDAGHGHSKTSGSSPTRLAPLRHSAVMRRRRAAVAREA